MISVNLQWLSNIIDTSDHAAEEKWETVNIGIEGYDRVSLLIRPDQRIFQAVVTYYHYRSFVK